MQISTGLIGTKRICPIAFDSNGIKSLVVLWMGIKIGGAIRNSFWLVGGILCPHDILLNLSRFFGGWYFILTIIRYST